MSSNVGLSVIFENTADLPRELTDSLRDEQSGAYLQGFLGADRLFAGENQTSTSAAPGTVLPRPGNAETELIDDPTDARPPRQSYLPYTTPLSQPLFPMPVPMVQQQISGQVNGYAPPHIQQSHENVRFSEAFGTRYVLKSKEKRPVRRVRMDNQFRIDNDEREALSLPFHGQVPEEDDDEVIPDMNRDPSSEESSMLVTKAQPVDDFELVELDEWDLALSELEDGKQVEFSVNPQVANRFFRNTSLHDINWEDSIIWDENVAQERLVKLRRADRITNSNTAVTQELRTSVRAVHTDAGITRVDKFNISNDHEYSSYDVKQGTIRQIVGPAVLQHSVPAIRLQYPYFKTARTVKELRHFHRPAFNVSVTEPITFSRVKNRAKKNKKKDAVVPQSSTELTLKDGSDYILLEYTEEYPPIMMNTGMGALIQNYYRKIDERDTTVPDLPIGEPKLLEPTDTSPFESFGQVEQGQTIQTLYTELLRAPVFPHTPHATDFLLIRTSTFGKDDYKSPKYYIRELPTTFVVGQTFAQVDVPKPRGRKMLNMVKYHMQLWMYRQSIKNRVTGEPNKTSALLRAFPGTAEAQLRQRFKGFAKFSRKAATDGVYELDESLPKDEIPEDYFRQLSPNHVCLVESARAWVQWLNDCGVSMSRKKDNDKDDDDDDDDDDKEEGATTDLQLQIAPWALTKTFRLAAQNKARVKLHGAGDPTGRGEGFSFIRTSAKEVFLRPGESLSDAQGRGVSKARPNAKYSVATEQTIYQDFIKTVWQNQIRTLSSAIEPELDDVNMQTATQYNAATTSARKQWQDEETERRRQMGGYSGASSPPGPTSPTFMGGAYGSGGPMSPAGSQDGSRGFTKGKTLFIKRRIRDNYGATSWQSEVVQDPQVIALYMKYRGQIPAEASPADQRAALRQIMDDLQTTGEVDHDGVPLQTATTLRSSFSEAGTSTGGKRRRNTVDDDGPSLAPRRSYGQRRSNPTINFHNKLEDIIKAMLSHPRAFDFLQVPRIPGYNNRIPNPMTLEMMRDKITHLQYRSVNEVIRDFEQIAINSSIFNGECPLTQSARKIKDEGIKMLQRERPYLISLEAEMNE
ncbi:hypothetical protein SmJEL517_g02938 [Synchytrium microbalum]|uniref:Bromo domain-containing protein n=1 Tax=Synchytrium microbalum TaxID=1806994 RepID=A0A507BZR6_9FUNG|nr:uncharacterized protein SmJEL517_g02938 [Synchytrium microbalum]TPX34297.1 hypothetical protein SmJEL517_g02938 [Synchytrium microbalum]